MRPTNGRGQTPTHGPSESAQRLQERIHELRGAANRRRAEAEAQRVLATAHTTP